MLKLTMIIIMMMFMKNYCIFAATAILLVLVNVHSQYLEVSKISYTLMEDLLSFWVISLSFWIVMAVTMIKMNHKSVSMKVSVAILMTFNLSFHSWNFMAFFIMFELSMVMIIIVVMSWGYQPERIEATLFMVLMTSMFSLPFFVTLMINLNYQNFWFINMQLTTWDYLSFMFIFMVKMPTYFVHVWLPKVHVEAPVQGSMILAAIMLKLGCYGIIRMLPMSFNMNVQWNAKVLAFSLWTAFILSMIANIQSDLKSMIAYSSIVHMTTTFASIMLNKPKSIMASIIVMVGHGLCSSGLFFICNFLYKHSKSRSVILNSGILAVSSPTLMMWFILCMSNTPMPPSINIVGELLMFKLMANWTKITMPAIFVLMFASSCYSILMFCLPAHGKFSINTRKPITITTKTLTIAWIHIIPLLLITVKASTVEI